MDYSNKTRDALLSLCKERGIKGYSGKKKSEILTLLAPEHKEEQEHTVDNPQYKKSLGQYFTISDTLQQFVFDNVKHKSSTLLEPSFGAGHLLKKFKEYDDNYPMICCELDSSLTPVLSFNSHQTIIYADFILHPFSATFKTIIGNPPYLKQKSGNLYLKFIERCFHYLADDGELIFIVPSDFIKLTSASPIIHKMTQSGSFTHFLFPHNEHLFDGASIDVVAFRYQKGYHTNNVIVNGNQVFCHVNQGIITFQDTEASGPPIESLFHVYVGLVSGRDEIFRMPFGNVDILSDKDRTDKYIFLDTFPTHNHEIDTHLLTHKDELLKRQIKKFSENDWFKWGAPRNLSSIRLYSGKPCIYVRNMTRNQHVAFIGTVQYFGGALLCLLPKNDMPYAQMNHIVQYMNTPSFQDNYIYARRFKIGHKQLSLANLPI